MAGYWTKHFFLSALTIPHLQLHIVPSCKIRQYTLSFELFWRCPFWQTFLPPTLPMSSQWIACTKCCLPRRMSFTQNDSQSTSNLAFLLKSLYSGGFTARNISMLLVLVWIDKGWWIDTWWDIKVGILHSVAFCSMFPGSFLAIFQKWTWPGTTFKRQKQWWVCYLSLWSAASLEEPQKHRSCPIPFLLIIFPLWQILSVSLESTSVMEEISMLL